MAIINFDIGGILIGNLNDQHHRCTYIKFKIYNLKFGTCDLQEIHKSAKLSPIKEFNSHVVCLLSISKLTYKDILTTV